MHGQGRVVSQSGGASGGGDHGDHGPAVRVHVRAAPRPKADGKKLTLFLLGKFRSHGGLEKERNKKIKNPSLRS